MNKIFKRIFQNYPRRRFVSRFFTDSKQKTNVIDVEGLNDIEFVECIQKTKEERDIHFQIDYSILKEVETRVLDTVNEYRDEVILKIDKIPLETNIKDLGRFPFI